MSEHLVAPLPEENRSWSERFAWTTSFFGTLSVLMVIDWAHSTVPVVPYNGWWTTIVLSLTGWSVLGLLYTNTVSRD